MILSGMESILAKPDTRAEVDLERGESGEAVTSQNRENSSTLTRMRAVATETEKGGADFSNEEKQEEKQPVFSDETNASLPAQGDPSIDIAQNEQGVIWKRKKQADPSHHNGITATPRRKIRDTLKNNNNKEKPS